MGEMIWKMLPPLLFGRGLALRRQGAADPFQLAIFASTPKQAAAPGSMLAGE